MLRTALAALGLFSAAAVRAEAPRALTPGERPDDRRLGKLQDLNGYFPFHPPASTAAWAERAERVRRQVLVATGLWPMPEKTPLNPVIHGRIDQDGYSVEKVYFESLPGFFVTGNLYRPAQRTGRHAAVLTAHGHWPQGRFMDNAKVRQEIVEGAERFEDGGRSILQSRCVQLARMGCVVFSYDMIGYADSVQIPFAIAHREFEDKITLRPELNTTENWGLWTTQAEARLQSVMGLQTWNSLRAFDFLASLPDVDPERIAVTGESGGGTQTFMLCAIDTRPVAAFPAVMVSTGMQGGCTCENATLLRVGTGNVEIAALFAPKPLGLTAANDWTREMATKGFPELQQLYKTLGAPANVMLKPLIHFRHNYNYVSRAVMYGWFNRHLKLGLTEPIVEGDYRRLAAADLSVWDATHPKPAGDTAFEQRLLRRLTDEASRQIREARESPERYRQLVGGAVDVMIGRNLATAGATQFVAKKRTDRGTHVESVGLLRNTTHREEVPVCFIEPKSVSNRAVIWLEGEGKSALFEPAASETRLRPEIQRLVASGVTVIGVDLFGQGEFVPGGRGIEKTRLVNNNPIAAYTFGYNSSGFAQRTHDILSVVRHLQSQSNPPKSIALAGLNGAGPLAAAARAQCGNAIERAAIATEGFRFGQVLDIQHENFLPGGAKYDDVPGLLALGAPQALWLAGEGVAAPAPVDSLYRAANASAQLTAYGGPATQIRAEVATWLAAAK